MTHNVENTPGTDNSRNRTGRSRAFIAFGLAALAVGGIGAAATSAAWTDNTWFAAPASAATFDLQGSLDGTTWAQSDDADGVQLVVPASALSELLPGQTRAIDLWVRNQGSVNAALTSDITLTSSTFSDAPTSTISGLAASLAPAGNSGSSDKFTLSLTTPADWSPVNQGATGTVIVTITATATA